MQKEVFESEQPPYLQVLLQYHRCWSISDSGNGAELGGTGESDRSLACCFKIRSGKPSQCLFQHLSRRCMETCRPRAVVFQAESSSLISPAVKSIVTRAAPAGPRDVAGPGRHVSSHGLAEAEGRARLLLELDEAEGRARPLLEIVEIEGCARPPPLRRRRRGTRLSSSTSTISDPTISDLASLDPILLISDPA